MRYRYRIITDNYNGWCIEEYVDGIIIGRYTRYGYTDYWLKSEYDSRGNIVRTIASTITGTIDWEKFYYNKRGLLIKKQNYYRYTSSYHYNRKNLLIKVVSDRWGVILCYYNDKGLSFLPRRPLPESSDEGGG